MWEILNFITKQLVLVIPLCLILGFLVGYFIDLSPLKNLIPIFTFIRIYPMMINLKFKKLLEGGDFKLISVTQFINFLVIPFLAYGLGVFFFRENYYLTLGLLMAGLVPTSGMTISWTAFAKGNVEAAVKMTVIGLILESLATPIYVQAPLSAHLEVDPIFIFRQIVFIVFIPMIAGYVTQRYLLKKIWSSVYAEKYCTKTFIYFYNRCIRNNFYSNGIKSKRDNCPNFTYFLYFYSSHHFVYS